MNRESRGKGEGGRHRPDVSHTLRMWLWLTFHLPAWPAASHPSLSSHLPVRMSAVFLDTASAPRRRPRFPCPLTICGPAASDRPSRGGRNPASDSTFSAHFWERSGLSFSPLRVRDGNIFMSSPEGQSNHSSNVSADVETNCVQQIKQICFFCGKRIIQGCDIDEALLWQWRKGNIS